jgi:hypothetical protein
VIVLLEGRELRMLADGICVNESVRSSVGGRRKIVGASAFHRQISFERTCTKATEFLNRKERRSVILAFCVTHTSQEFDLVLDILLASSVECLLDDRCDSHDNARYTSRPISTHTYALNMMEAVGLACSWRQQRLSIMA